MQYKREGVLGDAMRVMLWGHLTLFNMKTVLDVWQYAAW